MTPSHGRTTGGGRNSSNMGFQHLVSEAIENHVAIVGRHDLRSPHPDVPNHLIEITRVGLDIDPELNRNGDRCTRTDQEGPEFERDTHSALVSQFLAD